MYDWDFRIIWQNRWVFVHGGVITVEITLFSIVLGTAAGCLLGLGRSARPLWVRLPVSAFVELFLALPVLVLLIWIYYCGPLLVGINLSGFWTAVLGLSLSLSAFVAEIVRAGLQAVPKGQVEAARALGMTWLQSLVWITIPQAMRVIVPPLLGMYASTLKLSSLASVIAVYELLHSAQNLITLTFRPLEVYTTIAVVYVILILPLILVTRRLESIKGWRLS
jgi:polar amino acid transport system permease protein